MSSTTRLLVLGVVKLFQPVHGYIVRRELISWRAQEWASVQPGSIYNALKTLSRDGLLEVASTDQVGGRPERTTYRLTSAGEDEFNTLLREEWWTVRPTIDPLMAAVSFLSNVSRAEAIAALEHRVAQVRGMERHLEFAIEAHDGSDSPYHVREMMRLMTARVTAEIGWSEKFIERLRKGEYGTLDEPPWQPSPRATPPGARDTNRSDDASRSRRNTADASRDRGRGDGAAGSLRGRDNRAAAARERTREARAAGARARSRDDSGAALRTAKGRSDRAATAVRNRGQRTDDGPSDPSRNNGAATAPRRSVSDRSATLSSTDSGLDNRAATSRNRDRGRRALDGSSSPDRKNGAATARTPGGGDRATETGSTSRDREASAARHVRDQRARASRSRRTRRDAPR